MLHHAERQQNSVSEGHLTNEDTNNQSGWSQIAVCNAVTKYLYVSILFFQPRHVTMCLVNNGPGLFLNTVARFYFF